MGEGDQFDRMGVQAEFPVAMGRNGSGREELAGTEPGTGVREPEPRNAGPALPTGLTGRPLSGRSEAQGNRGSVPPPGRTLSVPAHQESESSSATQWFAGVVKQAVPFVHKLLPLLDGQIAAAVANLLTVRPHVPPPQRVDLQPIEHGLADLQVQQAGLKDQIADQNTALKRVEDHLQMVREATDRNTLEQQELIEDLKTITSRMNLLALLFLGLLVISVLLNIFLFLHIQRVLP